MSFKFGSDWNSRSLKFQIGRGGGGVSGGGSGFLCDNKAPQAGIGILGFGIWFGLGCGNKPFCNLTLVVSGKQMAPKKTTKMEDDHKGRQPKWKTNKMEDEQNGRVN